MRDGVPVARQAHRGAPVSFNQDSLKDFVTGFRKRRLERQSYAAAQEALKERRQRLEDRKERREALKAELIDKTKLRKRQREAIEEEKEEEAVKEEAESDDEGVKSEQIADPAAEQTNEFTDEFAHVTVVSRKVPGFSSDDEDDQSNDPTIKYESKPNQPYDPTKSKKPLKPKSRSMKGKRTSRPKSRSTDAPKKKGKPDPRGGNGKRRRKQ